MYANIDLANNEVRGFYDEIPNGIIPEYLNTYIKIKLDKNYDIAKNKYIIVNNEITAFPYPEEIGFEFNYKLLSWEKKYEACDLEEYYSKELRIATTISSEFMLGIVGEKDFIEVKEYILALKNKTKKQRPLIFCNYK